jgi:hypothetical protein
MVQDTPTFSNRVNGVLVPKRGPKMKHVGIQLGVFLFYLGCEGKAGSNYNICNFFKIGRGTANLYRKHVLDAVMYLSAKFIKWPDASERTDTGQRLGEKHFPLCMGIVDGTILPLMVKPRRHDACDFFCRKKSYALSTLIFCDDRKKILHHYSGWPGSVHDNRI